MMESVRRSVYFQRHNDGVCERVCVLPGAE